MEKKFAVGREENFKNRQFVSAGKFGHLRQGWDEKKNGKDGVLAIGCAS